jgi:hypothetical protein
VQRERHRVEGARDELGPRPRRFQGGRERGTSGSLTVEAHWESARLCHPLHELPRVARVEGAGGIVDEDARRPELGDLVRPREQHVRLPHRAGAVHEADGELLTGRADRLGRLAEVCHVVQRVVDAEDVDAARRRARDEAPHEIA